MYNKNSIYNGAEFLGWVDFSAQQYNALYKVGFNHVQPESLRMHFIIKYADL